ncbi:MAG: TetR/AcrR family transcriptional regulator [Mycobacteriales bacterium]
MLQLHNGGVAQRLVVSGTVAASPESLRERKKRERRQHISDVATGLFLERGFDEVRVADVALAAGVSEKTVYNYFETKEALLLDREQHMEQLIRTALGPEATTSSPIESFVTALLAEIEDFYELWGDADGFRTILRFTALIEETPSLRAAQRDMMDRLTQVAASAMAARAGVDPDDPEPQIAAAAIVGLWGVMFRSLRKQAETAADREQARAAVLSDVKRAARLIETGLWSFSLAVQGIHSRDQLRAAAEATNEARKQVQAALRQARSAWREARSHR